MHSLEGVGMSLNLRQKKFLVGIDKKVESILGNGGNEKTLLVETLEDIPEIKAIIDSVSGKELVLYIKKKHLWTFLCYIRILGALATGIADGTISVQK